MRWRRLPAARQALLDLAHLAVRRHLRPARCRVRHRDRELPKALNSVRVGETPFRYIREAVDIPAILAPSLAEAMKVIRAKAFVILDGTLLPLGWGHLPAGGWGTSPPTPPYYSGKHKRHGMNVQVLTDRFGRLLRASPTLPGSTHDLTDARHHGFIDAFADADLKCWADKPYQGAGGPVRVPFRGCSPKRWKRHHNTTHAKIRCLGE